MSVRAENDAFELCPVTKKRMFATEGKAHVFAKRLARKNKKRGDSHPVHVYRCDACNAYHVGHDPNYRRDRKPKSASPWRAWNPGALARDANDGDELGIPFAHRIVRV